MELIFLSLAFALSFLVVLLVMPIWINKVHKIKLVWNDMNKLNSPKNVAGSGGVVVVLGFLIGVLTIIGYKVFVVHSTDFLIEALALLVVSLSLAVIGLIDDLFGWQHGGLSVLSRICLVLISAIPLMAINAGKSAVSLPFFGLTDLGLLYPLIILPIGILGATTTFNMLAGFNGLEAGQGILLLSAIGLVGLFTGTPWIMFIAFSMVFALLAFLVFNFNPAKVFPGDVMTYPIGGLIAMFAILGNFEKIAVFFFIPYILETFLKLRGKLKMQSFGKPIKDGTLTLRYPKIYGLEHLSIYLFEKLKIKPTETRVVLSIWAFQLIIILLGFLIFREGIFS